MQRNSLRRSVLVAGTAAAALLAAGQAGAAGGSPAPAPDDPPAGVELGASTPRTRPAAPATVPKTRSPSRVTEPASVPTPDAPLVETSTPSADPIVPQVTPRARPVTAPSTPARVSKPAARTVIVPTVTRVAEQGRKRRSGATLAGAKPPRSATRPVRRVVSPPEQPVQRVPHDTIRVALPVGTFEVGRPDADTDALLLAAAAFLLGVAAAGTAVVGLAARRIARHA